MEFYFTAPRLENSSASWGCLTRTSLKQPPEDGNTSISGGSRAARRRSRPALVRISVEGRIQLPLDDFAAGDGRPDHGSVVGVAALVGNPGAHNVVPVLKRFTRDTGFFRESDLFAVCGLIAVVSR